MTTETLNRDDSTNQASDIQDTLSAGAIKKADVEQAYDLLIAEFGDDVTERLQDTLERLGYTMAQHVPQFISSYKARKANKGARSATAETANERAVLIARKAGASVQVAGDDATLAARAQSEESQTSTAATSTATETPESAEVDTGHTGDAEADDSAAGTGTSAGDNAVFEATGLGDLNLAKTGPIDRALKQNLPQVGSIQNVLDAIAKAEATVAEHDAALTSAREMLALHTDGDHDGANQLEIPQVKAPRSSGLVVELAQHDEDDVAIVDMALSRQSGDTVSSYQQLNDALAAAEAAAETRAQTLRDLKRDIRQAAPAQKATVQTTGADAQAPAEMDCDVVMRKASEIFKDVYGASSPILDFEIPTLEWVGDPHPDVPAVDSTYRFYAPVLAKVLFCLSKGKIPHLMGETGCGKSQMYQQIAARINFPFVRVNMDSHLTRADIVGTTKLMADENGHSQTRFIDGLIPYALKMPCILLIDELDLGDPEIMPVLQPVFEGNGMRLLEDRGRHVAQHPNCFIGSTGNTNLLGDDKQVYLNTHEQSGATRDRIAYYIHMPYLPADEEYEVITARVPDADEDFVKKMIQLANKTRDAYGQGEMGQLISTRHVADAVELYAHFGPLWNDEQEAVLDVLESTVFNFMDDQARAITRGLADGIFG